MNNQPTSSQQPSVAIRNYSFLVFYLVVLSALGSFVNDMYAPALPSMARLFGCSVSTAQMGLTMGMIGLALGQLILGPVSDRVGRKPVLVGSMAVFIVAAVISVFSPTIHFFLGCRVFQGIGAAGAYFLARTIPADLYGGRALAKLMAIVGAINGLAPAASPVIGGIITEAWSWKGVFWVLAAFALVLIALSPLSRESLPKDRRFKGPWSQELGRYLVLLRNKPFMVHVTLKGAALGLLFAYISSSSFIVQTVYGFSATGYGLIIGGNALFCAAGSMAALRFKLLKNAGVVGAWMLVVVMTATCVSLWLVKNFWVYELLMLPMMVALGMIFTMSNTLAMNEGRSSAGEASAVLGVSGYVFGAIVAPLVGAGDMLHSTAIVYAVLTVILIVAAEASRRLPADLGK